MMQQNQFQHSKEERNEKDAVSETLQNTQSYLNDGFPACSTVSTKKQGHMHLDVPVNDDIYTNDKKLLNTEISSNVQTNSQTRKGLKKKTCRHCGKVFDSRLKLKNHLQEEIKARDRKLSCHICMKPFLTWKLYSLHKCDGSTKGSDKGNACIYVCAYCGRIVHSERVLNEHNKTKSKTCKVCNQVFCRSKAMEQHKMTHEQHYKCNTCSLTFRFEAGLRNHIAAGHKTYKCDYCDTVFMCRWSMVSHLEKQHSIRLRKRFGKTDKNESKNKECIDTGVVPEYDKTVTNDRDEIETAVASISDINDTDTFAGVTTESNFTQFTAACSQGEEIDGVCGAVRSDTTASESKLLKEYPSTSSLQSREKGVLLNEFATAVVSCIDNIETYGVIGSFQGQDVLYDHKIKYEQDNEIQNETAYITENETESEIEIISIPGVLKSGKTGFPKRDKTFISLAYASENVYIDKDTDIITNDSSIEVDKQSPLGHEERGIFHINSDGSETSTYMNACNTDQGAKGVGSNFNADVETLSHMKSKDLTGPKRKQIRTATESSKFFSKMTDDIFLRDRDKSKFKLTLPMLDRFNGKDLYCNWTRDSLIDTGNWCGFEKENINAQKRLCGNLSTNKAVSDKRTLVTSHLLSHDENEKLYSSEKCALSRFESDIKEKASSVQIKIENVENGVLVNYIEVANNMEEIVAQDVVCGEDPVDIRGTFNNEPNRKVEHFTDVAYVKTTRKGKCETIDVTVNEAHSEKSSDSDSNEDSDGYEECTAEEIQEMLSSL